MIMIGEPYLTSQQLTRTCYYDAESPRLMTLGGGGV